VSEFEFDDLTTILRQIRDLKTYRIEESVDPGEPITTSVKRGWMAALEAMEYWCEMRLERKRGRG
jgi:hypothetical protein